VRAEGVVNRNPCEIRSNNIWPSSHPSNFQLPKLWKLQPEQFGERYAACRSGCPEVEMCEVRSGLGEDSNEEIRVVFTRVLEDENSNPGRVC